MFFSQLYAILRCRPASTTSNLVASVPVSSKSQESSGNFETDEREVDAIDDEQGQKEHDNGAANEGKCRDCNRMFEIIQLHLQAIPSYWALLLLVMLELVVLTPASLILLVPLLLVHVAAFPVTVAFVVLNLFG